MFHEEQSYSLKKERLIFFIYQTNPKAKKIRESQKLQKTKYTLYINLQKKKTPYNFDISHSTIHNTKYQIQLSTLLTTIIYINRFF